MKTLIFIYHISRYHVITQHLRYSSVELKTPLALHPLHLQYNYITLQYSMKISSILALTLLPAAAAFAPQAARTISTSTTFTTSTILHSSASKSQADEKESSPDANVLSRRDALWKAGIAASLTFVPLSSAQAEDSPLAAASVLVAASPETVKNIVVAGATGQTGSRIYEKLRAQSDFSATGGVRNVAKASKALGSSASTGIKRLDVVEDSLETLTATLKDAGADGLIIACGMNPGKNLLRMSAAAHEVDNVGTCKLIDAAQKAGIKKIVLVSSILTNGRAWGQEDSPGFKITNAFGGALDEKLEAEKYLRKSGMDYTIVRPGKSSHVTSREVEVEFLSYVYCCMVLLIEHC